MASPNNAWFIKTTARLNTMVFRLTGGAIGSRFGKASVLLLTTTGRKSGKPRTTPLIYVEDGDNVAIVASNGGRDDAPLWWHNLQAVPQATIRTKRTTRTVRAERATPEEQSRLWPLLTAVYPDYDVYTTRTKREIPVVLLKPQSGGPAVDSPTTDN
jgi:deazaflavin-dependent oxidoreductase (nitroreductase family)